MTTHTPKASFALITTFLPGPDRKRRPSPYHYRVTYRNPEPSESGCQMTWDVLGGRERYQLALEQTTTGETVWHCTCADAVYRDKNTRTRHCKHVSGLRGLLPQRV